MAQAEAAAGRTRVYRGSDPFLALWRVFTSVRFALAIIGFLVLSGLLAVMIPQVPAVIRGSDAAVSAWVQVQEGKFGPLAQPMHRLGFFEIFSARWFLFSLGVLVVSVSVCTANRFAPIWRNVTKPPERVSDSFFERVGNRVRFEAGGDDLPARVESTLRGRWFKVRTFNEGPTTYLFADRFSWAQLGTFLSHLALILFLAGALISRAGGFTTALFIGEGTTNPIFPVSHPDQIQVEVIDAVGEFDETGTPLDYRTELVIYQGGREVSRGVSTVNDPVSYGGYRFLQAGYFGDGAAVRVMDASTGRTLYREVLALQDLSPAPAIIVRDASGAALLDDVIVPTDFVEDAAGTLISVPGTDREFWVGVEQDAEGMWNLVVFGRDEEDARFVVREGEARRAGDLEFTFVEATGLPSTLAPGFGGDGQEALLMMSQAEDGEPVLTVLRAAGGSALTMRPEEPVSVDGKEYLFEGRREFAGIEVRRDPGANFIWVASGLLIAGLAITFYVPRLRLWARVRGGEAVFAGLAEKSGSFQSEVRRLLKELGAEPRPSEEEDDAHA